MPVTVVEKFGRQYGSTNAELFYIIRGTDDDQAAHQAMIASAPPTHGYLYRREGSVEEIGDGQWLGSVRYAPLDRVDVEVGQSTFAFETRGGTQHVTQSLQTVSSYSIPGVTAPNFRGAIGVTDDGVDGCDITVPVYTFSETHYLDPVNVTTAYKGTLFALTATVNTGAFKGLNPGECLFLGAAGTQRGTDPWEITYAFAGSPNITGLTLGEITGIAKKGWEYLWLRYKQVEDATAKMIIHKPLVAFVEKVYRDGDFALLNIGT